MVARPEVLALALGPESVSLHSAKFARLHLATQLRAPEGLDKLAPIGDARRSRRGEARLGTPDGELCANAAGHMVQAAPAWGEGGGPTDP
eukprot:3017575-Prymnesium_polylepis.2